MAKKDRIQPARKSYFFQKGYVDTWNTIKGAWAYNFESIKVHIALLVSCPDIGWQKFPYWLFHLLAILSVGVFGSLVSAGMTLLTVGVLGALMAVIYLLFSCLWLCDRAYLLSNKIFIACPECKERSLIPLYHCPQCGEIHSNLTPGVYGILQRRCLCGQKLPTNCFNGRKKLESSCPACSVALGGRESRPLCIPVVGGRSVGKTAFITAFSRDFLEQVAPQSGIETEMYDQSKADIYQEIVGDYGSGSTRMTQRAGGLSQTSSVSFSFFASHPSLTPERLIHIYDVAGEVFTGNEENEVQKHYDYCQGIVLMIDPFGIPLVRNQYFEQLSAIDQSSIGTADIDGIIDSFLNKLREVTGMSDKKMASVPLAVVMSKVDSPGVREELGENAIRQKMAAEMGSSYLDAQDALCREFLEKYEMGSLLNHIKIQFKHHKFFACSAIGHTREQGAYEPRGVMEPMRWLIAQADPKLEKLLPQGLGTSTQKAGDKKEIDLDLAKK